MPELGRILSLVVTVGAPGALAQSAAPAPAPAASPPAYATTKVADNVYVFRMLGHQSMFVVTPENVIATDPLGFVNKKGGEIFLAEPRGASTTCSEARNVKRFCEYWGRGF